MVTECSKTVQGVGRDGDDDGAILAKGKGTLDVVAALRHGLSDYRHISNLMMGPLLFVSLPMRGYSPSASST